MRKQYIIYHPATNSSPYLKSFYNEGHFSNIDLNKFTPILYKNVAAAKAAITFSLKQHEYSNKKEEYESYKSFLIGIQIVEVSIKIESVAFEYLFDIEKINK